MRNSLALWAFSAFLLITGATAAHAASTVRVDVNIEDGSALPGTTITATDGKGGRFVTVSNAAGNARFLGLTPGCWVLTFELEGFATQTKTICVDDASDVSVSANMQTAEVTEELVVTAGLGGSYSRVENNSSFGIGTAVSPVGEKFGASLGGHIDRYGFDLSISTRIKPGFIFGDEGHGRFYAGLSYAEGSLSGSGSQTVGVGGVTQIGLTFLELDGGFGTGVGSAVNGDSLITNANLDNSWAIGSLGYRESFYPSGPTGIKVSFGGALSFEDFRNDFAAEGDIVRGGVSLVEQETHAFTTDNYFGFTFTGGVSKFFYNRKLWVGVEAYATPSYHSGQAEISQFTNFGGGISQTLQYSNDGFALSGGLRLKARYRVSENTRIKLGYEYSILDDVTEVHVPANPLQQPAQFDSGPVERHFVHFGISRKF